VVLLACVQHAIDLARQDLAPTNETGDDWAPTHQDLALTSSVSSPTDVRAGKHPREIPLPGRALARTIMSKQERNVTVKRWSGNRPEQDEKYASMPASLLPGITLAAREASG
jgi:hypothetical protein